MCSYSSRSSGNTEHPKLINSDIQYQKHIKFTTVLSNQISHINCHSINVSAFTTVLLIRLQLAGTVPYFKGKQHLATTTCRENLQTARHGSSTPATCCTTWRRVVNFVLRRFTLRERPTEDMEARFHTQAYMRHYLKMTHQFLAVRLYPTDIPPVHSGYVDVWAALEAGVWC